MKLNVRLCLILGTVLLSSCVFAGTMNHQPTSTSYENFYIGANIGASSLADKESTDNPIRDLHYLSSAGIIGGGLIGYDLMLRDHLKVGLEGFINATDLDLSSDQNYSPVSSYTVNMRYNLGLRVLPGYEFTPGTGGHVIIGYSHAKFDIKDNGNYGIINTQFKKNGLQLGMGMKTYLFKNISIRTDILYTDYSSQTSHGLTTSTPVSIQTYHNNPATLEGNLVLIYKFS